jgi:hypothetical protein
VTSITPSRKNCGVSQNTDIDADPPLRRRRSTTAATTRATMLDT